jgi:hypothetical protein
VLQSEQMPEQEQAGPADTYLDRSKSILRVVMARSDDGDFASVDDARVTIRAAVNYLLRGSSDGVRGEILQGIITLVRQAANEPPPSKQSNPFDDDAPGG